MIFLIRCRALNLEISQLNCSVDIFFGVISTLRCLSYYWVLKIKMSAVKWLLYSGGLRNLGLKNHNQSSVFSIAVFKRFNKVAAGCHFAWNYLIDYLEVGDKMWQHKPLNSCDSMPQTDNPTVILVIFHCPPVED